MEHITIKYSGEKANLTPDAGYQLQRGPDPRCYSSAQVRNTPKEMRQWKAVKVDVSDVELVPVKEPVSAAPTSKRTRKKK